MRVLVMVPVYGTALPTGAFITTSEYVQALAANGHTMHVITTLQEPGTPRTVDGVRVWPLRYWRQAVQAAQPELLISHHGDRRHALIAQIAVRTPHLLMVHGMSANRHLGRPVLAWFPSAACRGHYVSYRGQTLVLPPPINPARYVTTPGHMITLNGSTVAKGADILAAVARHLPDMQFLVARNVTRNAVPLQTPNITVVPRIDPRDLYARTRILLMPSTTESYGRAGVEAMLSGIPVLASPLPGMREAFGDAATYIPRDQIGLWVQHIRHLSDPAVYAEASTKAREHAAGLDYAGNLAAFEAACLGVVQRATPVRRPAVRRPSTPPRARR